MPPYPPVPPQYDAKHPLLAAPHPSPATPQYDAKRRASPDPEIVAIIEESRRAGGLLKDPSMPRMSDQEIIEFIFFPVVNEGCRCGGRAGTERYHRQQRWAS